MRLSRPLLIAAILALAAVAAIYSPVRALLGGGGAEGGVAAPTPAQVATRPAAAAEGAYAYRFSIDRGATPQLYYNELTYVVHVGPASALTATVDGEPVEGVYNAASGDYLLTTDRAGQVELRFTSDAPPGEVTVRKASLKGDRAWAWSHSFDDNVNLQAQIEVLRARGWRATLMLIAKEIDDTRDEGWIVDAPLLRTLLDEGWSLGNHSWDHNCDSDSSAEELRGTMLDGYGRLLEVVRSSNTPGYQVLAFAAPCFISAYDPIFDKVMAAGETTLRFNESQGNPLMNVDGADYTSDEVTASAVDASVSKIGRDISIELDPAELIATFAWMSANKAPDRHFWVNTLTHGNKEEGLGQVVEVAYGTYGPGGSDELWMAPSDEIYSYLLVRDSTLVTPGELARP